MGRLVGLQSNIKEQTETQYHIRFHIAINLLTFCRYVYQAKSFHWNFFWSASFFVHDAAVSMTTDSSLIIEGKYFR